MEVEDHVLTLHLLKDRVEGLVGDNAGRRVGGHAGRVGFNSSDAGLLCLDDGLRSDVWVQVERHEESDIWGQALQAFLVVQSVLRSRDRRNQVGLRV